MWDRYQRAEKFAIIEIIKINTISEPPHFPAFHLLLQVSCYPLQTISEYMTYMMLLLEYFSTVRLKVKKHVKLWF